MDYSDEHKYEDIINMPHHVSASRPRMSMIDRAAQFSAFALEIISIFFLILRNQFLRQIFIAHTVQI